MKALLAEGRVPLGILLSFPGARVVEMCAISGADLVIADIEHHPFDWRDLEDVVRACEATGITPLVRTLDDDGPTIGRLIDTGFQGIMVPNVETGEAARGIVDAALYPPAGHRGVDFSRWSGFGLDPRRDERLEEANSQLSVIVMIESAAGVANAADILSTPGIDAVVVGLVDLSASMGRPGETRHPEVLAAQEHVHDLARANGKLIVGSAAVASDVPALIAQGMQMVSVSISRLIGSQVEAFAAAAQNG